MRKSTEYIKVCKEFKRFFSLDYHMFNDWLFASNNEIAIDIEKFSAEMDKRHGYLDKDDVSLSDIIEKEYGREAKELIQSLI